LGAAYEFFLREFFVSKCKKISVFQWQSGAEIGPTGRSPLSLARGRRINEDFSDASPPKAAKSEESPSSPQSPNETSSWPKTLPAIAPRSLRNFFHTGFDSGAEAVSMAASLPFFASDTAGPGGSNDGSQVSPRATQMRAPATPFRLRTASSGRFNPRAQRQPQEAPSQNTGGFIAAGQFMAVHRHLSNPNRVVKIFKSEAYPEQKTMISRALGAEKKWVSAGVPVIRILNREAIEAALQNRGGFAMEVDYIAPEQFLDKQFLAEPNRLEKIGDIICGLAVKVIGSWAANGLTHPDLKPDNVAINPATGDYQITDTIDNYELDEGFHTAGNFLRWTGNDSENKVDFVWTEAHWKAFYLAARNAMAELEGSALPGTEKRYVQAACESICDNAKIRGLAGI